MPDDELDELYGVKPEEFTALRAQLVAAAKRRGEAARAQRISAARRPTTAAWVVNVLVHQSETVRQRLTDLGLRLRAAHAAMAGEDIRTLSAEQRVLVEELARAAFTTVGLTDPSAALHDEVTGTLQAAIADPDVAERLGRLAKAERYSGFGELGETSPVVTSTRGGTAKARQVASAAAAPDRDVEAERQRIEKLTATLAAAKRANAVADRRLSERRRELAAAEQRVREAEGDRDTARQAYEKAQQDSHAAAESMQAAEAGLTGEGRSGE